MTHLHALAPDQLRAGDRLTLGRVVTAVTVEARGVCVDYAGPKGAGRLWLRPDLATEDRPAELAVWVMPGDQRCACRVCQSVREGQP